MFFKCRSSEDKIAIHVFFIVEASLFTHSKTIPQGIIIYPPLGNDITQIKTSIFVSCNLIG